MGISIFYTIVGAVIGGLVTFYFTRKKFEKETGISAIELAAAFLYEQVGGEPEEIVEEPKVVRRDGERRFGDRRRDGSGSRNGGRFGDRDQRGGRFNDRDQRNGGHFGEKNGSYRSERDGRQRRFGNDSRRSDRRQAENGGRRRTSGEGSYRAAGSGFKGEKR